MIPLDSSGSRDFSRSVTVSSLMLVPAVTFGFLLGGGNDAG